MINVSLENTLQKKKSFLFFLSSIFIAEYGTSYVEEVSMGAKMVVETRFNKRANGVDETAQRMSCIAVRHTYIYLHFVLGLLGNCTNSCLHGIFLTIHSAVIFKNFFRIDQKSSL